MCYCIFKKKGYISGIFETFGQKIVTFWQKIVTREGAFL
jgi:hypothetical protein